MNSHKNAPLTPKGREAMGAQCGGRRTEPGRCGLSVQYDTQDGCQMGQAVPRRRCGWVARPLLKTSFIAEPNSACHVHGDRGLALLAPRRHCERSEAIHPAACSTMDCLVALLLAMTRVMRALQIQFPGLACEIDAETVMPLFRHALETGTLIDAARGNEDALGPERDLAIALLAREADALL